MLESTRYNNEVDLRSVEGICKIQGKTRYGFGNVFEAHCWKVITENTDLIEEESCVCERGYACVCMCMCVPDAPGISCLLCLSICLFIILFCACLLLKVTHIYLGTLQFSLWVY